jgi:hypothetical protein
MTADHEPRDDLSRFLSETMRARRLSYSRLAARAVDSETGHALGSQWLALLAKKKLTEAPGAWQVRALAAGLDVDPDMISGLAARQWLEFEVAQVTLGRPYDWALYLRRRDLDEGARAALDDVVTRFIRRQESRLFGEGGEGPDEAQA